MAADIFRDFISLSDSEPFKNAPAKNNKHSLILNDISDELNFFGVFSQQAVFHNAKKRCY
jgi:hypothetical protein